MDTRINERDIKHLQAFPDERKASVMRKIMSQKPDRSLKLNGQNDFEKTMLKLRREGYKLIDLQRHETSFSSVWYRRGVSMLGRGRAHVTMLVWEQEEPAPSSAQEPSSSTTVLTWRVRP